MAAGPDRANKASEAAVACPLLEGIDLSGARGVLVLIAANRANFRLSESRNVMNTIRRYAAEDAHVIYGTAYDDTLGDQLRVTVIATGLSPVKRQQAAPIQVVHSAPVQRTGTDNIPVLTTPVQSTPPAHDYTALNTPSVGATAAPRPRRSMRWPATAWTRSRSRPSCASRRTDPSRRFRWFHPGAWRAPGASTRGVVLAFVGHTSPHLQGENMNLLAAARRAAVSFVCALGPMTALHAATPFPADVAGGADHPMLKRFTGSALVGYKSVAWDRPCCR